jgi:ABC-type transport system involved in multi-copper enzyme maturation permease subunit
MSRQAITDTQRDDRSAATDAAFMRELAPSLIREDDAGISRWIGAFGLVLAVVGAGILAYAYAGHAVGALRAIIATLLFAVGMVFLLFHATCDKDLQLRRTYGIFGALWVVGGLVMALLALFAGARMAGFFMPGAGALGLGLLFVLAFLRNETETDLRTMAINVVGGLGALAAAGCFLGTAFFGGAFLLPNGFLLGLLGLGYLWAFVTCRGLSDDIGNLATKAIGAVGGLVILGVLFRSYVLTYFKFDPYMIPTGLLLAALGGLYVALYVLLWVDTPFLALTRRELGALFYSPIGYLVLIGSTGIGWVALVLFLKQALFYDEDGGEPLFEPIVRSFFFGLVPVLVAIGAMPFLTMRSLSEEKRTGTLEVLLTVPIGEWSVVLSKFTATLLFYMLIWVPWGLYMVDLRIEGGTPFDFRPVLSFLIVLLCTGANFVGMGLFFSSITRNQIISGILTFAGMMGFLLIYFASIMVRAPSPWAPVLNHLSFVQLWYNSLDGKLQPQFLLFHISAAIVWLFLIVKVLEFRKWS